MIEYFTIHLEFHQDIDKILNEYAKIGWRIIAVTAQGEGYYYVMERKL